MIGETSEKKSNADMIRGYYIYTSDNLERSIVICPKMFDNSLPNDEEHMGANLRLVVHKRHKNYCF